MSQTNSNEEMRDIRFSSVITDVESQNVEEKDDGQVRTSVRVEKITDISSLKKEKDDEKTIQLFMKIGFVVLILLFNTPFVTADSIDVNL